MVAVGLVTLVTAAGFRLPLLASIVTQSGLRRSATRRPCGRGNPFANAVRSLGDARRVPAFWLLAGSFFICGASTNGLIGTHLIPAATDHGFGQVAAASLVIF